jgi:LytS/YehU family sensor histidine kinase
VKHGIAPRPGGGLVRIQAGVQGNTLHVVVSDTGGGFAAEKSKSGVGLDNVSRRLQLCYGPEASLTIRSDGNGASVSFAIPVVRYGDVDDGLNLQQAVRAGEETRVVEAGD